MRLLHVLVTVYTLHVVVEADPIVKDRQLLKMYKAPPSLIAIPQEIEEEYALGDTNAPIIPADAQHQGGDEGRLRRDYVCDTQANSGCHARCISLEEQCLCATNGHTYRNQCEMSCMRKVQMEKINWLHFEKCEPICSSERVDIYKGMVADLLEVEYLKKKVKRCSRITNCAQAKLVVQYTAGNQSILECPENLAAFLLFSGLECSGMIQLKLERILNNEPVINCPAAITVNNKLFNDKNCARSRKGPDQRTLIQWSFDKWDTNGDRRLENGRPNSVAELGSLLSRIPDQECKETFFDTCDADQDGYIMEDEWAACLGCRDCYRPCHVFQAKKQEQDRSRRFVESVVSCSRDGSCAKKQCEKHFARHVLCWCVDEDCNAVEGSEPSYAATSC